MHMQARNINNFRAIKIGAVCIMASIVITSCKKKEPVIDPNAAANQANVVKPAPTLEPVKEKPIYVYSGDKFRDPFVSAGQSSNYQPEAIFDPKRMTIRGIVFSPNIKSAVLTVSGGSSYFVKDDVIFDVMGKVVKGFTAKVLEDKVILMGEADNVFELKIRNTEKGDKTQ
jgi:hypothetical protein